MQLYRKLKNLTDLSARDFIRYVRLQRAAQLLKNSQLTVSEIAYQVGFNDPGYFTRCFKKQFNQSPLSYAKEIGKETGLGLFISHEIIEKKHGGTLSFQSKLGQGTEFVIKYMK